MFNALYNALLEWNRNATEREKLQHVLILVTLLAVLIAGVISLIEPQSGQDFLIIPFASGLIFLVNAIVWNLLDSVILARLSGKRKKQ